MLSNGFNDGRRHVTDRPRLLQTRGMSPCRAKRTEDRRERRQPEHKTVRPKQRQRQAHRSHQQEDHGKMHRERMQRVGKMQHARNVALHAAGNQTFLFKVRDMTRAPSPATTLR